MSITGSNNPFACDPVVFANANSIVSLGTITRDGNQFTFSVGFVWKINGVTYQNTAPVVITIAEASEGFNRIDNALLNTSNTIELQQGLESETIALRPVAPETNIILTSWNISGTTIGDTAPSIVGVEFKKKIENTRYKSRLSGENVIIPFQAAGQSHYSVTNTTLVSVAGFTTAGLTTPMYEGQDVIFENQTGHEITLKDSFGVDTSFVIGADLIVPNEGKIWFRFRNNELELIDKNWFKINEVATAQNLGEFINSLDSKTNIKDTDEFVLSDSDDGLKSKKTRFLDFKTKLKSYFDTFYLSLSIFNDFATDVFSSLDNKLDKSTTPSSVYGTNTDGGQTMIPLTNFGTVKGTGTTNCVSKFTGSGTIGDSQIFDNGTNVGIGTNVPQRKLDVNGDFRAGNLTIRPSSNLSVIENAGTGNSILFIRSGGTNPLVLNDAGGGVIIGVSATPGARLDVRAQGALSTDIAFRVRNSADNNDLIRVQGNGNVGIGTTNPLYKLHVVGDLFASTQIIAGTHVYSPNITNPSSANNSQVSLNNYGTRVTRNIADSNTVFGVINSNASSTGAIQTWNNSAGEVMRVTSTGDIGIATSEPKSRLHVVGLPSYADNASAIAGGLTVGAFYHTGGILKVVI